MLAGALGAAVGLERELREREAGLRTHLLVSLGACLFTLASAYGFHDFFTQSGALVRTDPTRIAAQVVSGIGFLGAGAIIRHGLSVRGLTTAATLWVVAALGLACGAGYYVAAALTTVIALVSLGPLRIGAYKVVRRFRAEEGRLLVSLAAGTSPGSLIDEVERSGLRIQSLEIGHEADRRQVELDVQMPHGQSPPTVVARLADVDDVLEVRWAD